MTGSEFSSIFDLKVDKTYSGFLNSTKKNRLFKEALITSIEKKYRSLDFQKEYDEIITSIKTEVVYSLNNNTISTAPIHISNVSFPSTTVTVTTNLAHNLAVGDLITISGVLGGVTNINGNQTVVSVTSDFVFTFTAPGLPAGAYTVDTGTISSSKMIVDYMHLLTVKTKYAQNIDSIDIEKISNASPIVITIDGQNNLRTGEQIYVSGVSGNTNANGYRYIKKINKYKIALYSDAKLAVPVAGNSAFFVGGSIARVNYNYAQQYVSDRKISSFSPPSVDQPGYEMVRNKIKFYPISEVCSEITIDYISNDIKYIDSANTSLDLEQYYPAKFLYYVADEAANMFAQSIKDGELFQTSNFELNNNP